LKSKLTQKAVEKITPPVSGRLDVFDQYLPGFALRITPAGHRTYIARARIKGQAAPITFTIGDAVDITLGDARLRAAEILRQMRDGIDPRPAKGPTPEALTLRGLVNKWAQLHLAKKRPRYATEAVRAISKAFHKQLDRPASSLTRAAVVNVLDEITLSGKPVAAARTRTYGRSCYSWALKRGDVDNNPFAGLPVEAEKSERERVLDTEEVRAIWAAAGTLGYPWEGFFKLSLLTLQRRSEVAGMLWSEIDFDGVVWRISGDRMKTGKPHSVHLSPPALAVLEGLPRFEGADFVFSMTGTSHISGYSKAKRHLDAAVTKMRGAPLAQWWPHDFRRSGVTTLASMGFDALVVDLLLAHRPGVLRGVAGVYQRHDFASERAAALDAWAAHVTGLDADNVVSLPARAAQ
jgi:integrase